MRLQERTGAPRHRHLRLMRRPERWRRGDLTVMLDQLRRAVPGVELTVFTRNVTHTDAHHDVERAIDARESLRDELVDEVERLDVLLLLLGGGGILSYAIGAGPLQRRPDRRAVAAVLNGMPAIMVRDARTRRLLEAVGVERDITVTGDPALLLEDGTPPGNALEREGIDPDRRLDMAIGMRLHFLIFAALSGVRILGLPYASKVSSFPQQLGLSAPDQIQPEHAGTLLASS